MLTAFVSIIPQIETSTRGFLVLKVNLLKQYTSVANMVVVAFYDLFGT